MTKLGKLWPLEPRNLGISVIGTLSETSSFSLTSEPSQLLEISVREWYEPYMRDELTHLESEMYHS